MLFKPRRIRKAWARNAPQTIGKHVRMPIQTITSVLRVNNKYKPQLEGSPFILFLIRSGFGPKFGTVARKWARWGLGNIPITTKISEHPYFTQNLIHTKFQDDRGRSDEISWILLLGGSLPSCAGLHRPTLSGLANNWVEISAIRVYFERFLF